jgi:hypothetical protein
MDDPLESQRDSKPLTSFPELVKDLPSKASQVIIRQMNLDRDINWMSFAEELWPLWSLDEIEGHFKEKEKMKAVLSKWGSKGGTTNELFEILNKLPRKDVIVSLEKHFPFVRYFPQFDFSKDLKRIFGGHLNKLFGL